MPTKFCDLLAKSGQCTKRVEVDELEIQPD